MENDLKALLITERKYLAEDIQKILEESEIYSTLKSDNPASSLLNIYSGLNVVENITLLVSLSDYSKAVEIIKNSRYKDLLTTIEE